MLYIRNEVDVVIMDNNVVAIMGFECLLGPVACLGKNDWTTYIRKQEFGAEVLNLGFLKWTQIQNYIHRVKDIPMPT